MIIVTTRETETKWLNLARIIDTDGGVYYYPKPRGAQVRAAIGNTNLNLIRKTLETLPAAINTLQIKNPGTTQAKYNITLRKRFYNLQCTKQEHLYPLLSNIADELWDSNKQGRAQQALQYMQHTAQWHYPTITERTQHIQNLYQHGWTPQDLHHHLPYTHTQEQLDKLWEQHQPNEQAYQQRIQYFQERGATLEEANYFTGNLQKTLNPQQPL